MPLKHITTLIITEILDRVSELELPRTQRDFVGWIISNHAVPGCDVPFP